MKFTAAAAVLPVRDLEASLQHFTEVLGFEKDFRFGQYAGVKRDHCCLHLSEQGNPNTGKPGTGSVYIFCDQVDEYFNEIKQKGAAIAMAPMDYEYGMRDFIAHDPDGNQLSFGAPTTST